MLTNLKQSAAGFSLLEVVVVMVIIGILATIAYPMYQNHVRQTRRADAKSALVELAQLQEKYYFRNSNDGGSNHTYATDFNILKDEEGLSGFKVESGTILKSREGYYEITFTDSTERTFQFTARPTDKGGQDSDSCEEFNIDNVGNKNSIPAGECW